MRSDEAGSSKSHWRTHTIRSLREQVEREWEFATSANDCRICSTTVPESTFKRIRAVSASDCDFHAYGMVITEPLMNKLRVVIVDDEELARSVLREYLQEHSDVEIVGE